MDDRRLVDAKGIVALLAEGVDRNESMQFNAGIVVSRPPRGGRG